MCVCAGVLGEAAAGGRQARFGKSDPGELKKAELVSGLNPVTSETYCVSKGRE